MKLNFIYTLLFLAILLSCAGGQTSNKKKESNTFTAKVMTYNIRLNTPNDGENAWPNRKSFLTSQIQFLSPDVLGVQEALPGQVKDLDEALVEYKSFGEGRDGNGQGEHSSIYYNINRVKVDEYDTFWLSEKPEEVSKGWDAALPRVCTYGLFSTLDNTSKFWVFNTHFDHVGVEARKQSVKLILKQIALKNKENYPVVLIGDLNVTPDSDVIAETKSAMVDAKNVSKVTFGNNGTFNGFKYDKPANRRIDYILMSKTALPIVEKYAVLTSAVDFKFPSDHFPVFVEFTIK